MSALRRPGFLPLLLPLALAACTRVTALEGPAQDLHTVYTEAIAAPREPPTLQETPLTGAPDAPPLPVMHPPQIQRVWVPEHLNRHGDVISGHWVYLLLERGQWSLETLPVTEPPTLHAAPPAPAPLPPVSAPARRQEPRP
jgi:hypothetical protein